jgi:hypothetical protein
MPPLLRSQPLAAAPRSPPSPPMPGYPDVPAAPSKTSGEHIELAAAAACSVCSPVSGRVVRLACLLCACRISSTVPSPIPLSPPSPACCRLRVLLCAWLNLHGRDPPEGQVPPLDSHLLQVCTWPCGMAASAATSCSAGSCCPATLPSCSPCPPPVGSSAQPPTIVDALAPVGGPASTTAPVAHPQPSRRRSRSLTRQQHSRLTRSSSSLLDEACTWLWHTNLHCCRCQLARP